MTIFPLQTFVNVDVFALHGTPTPIGSFRDVEISNVNVSIIQIQLSFEKPSDDRYMTRVCHYRNVKHDG